jgi:hypothetical protein
MYILRVSCGDYGPDSPQGQGFLESPVPVKFRGFLAIDRGDRAGGGIPGVSSRISSPEGLFLVVSYFEIRPS